MEFKPYPGATSALTKEHPLFLSRCELEMILTNEFLHNINSFFIVEKDGTYKDDEKYAYGTAIFKIKEIENAFKNGHTILVKNIENWNESIQKECINSHNSVNVHLYLSPKNGSSFDWHTDDRDVFVYMQYGKKKFEVKEQNGEIKTYDLVPGDCLYIPYGLLHRAFSDLKTSIHLSFGQWPQGLTIDRTYPGIDVSLNLE